MRNRIKRLNLEHSRAEKNTEATRAKADEIVRLKAHNELKARAREVQKQQEEEELRHQQQKNAIIRAQREASIRANRQAAVKMKQKMVVHHRKEKLALQQATANFRRLEEERTAKLKHDIYIKERQAVHKKYKDRHLMQMQAVRTYDNKVEAEERNLLQRERMIQQMEDEEAQLLQRLKVAQELQRGAYSELEVALQV
eukprot:CAMPEP_0184309124 /NCGR_PEP_ID=MMETSP1049-20130417/17386_1 /TAXON_ID=77928 /ORGANISM="Proteomonas sulcata, Strain CCMP704" /LENGTH=197 /DNA_ID=CAMNT_0026621949 /DNA_START=235 /DNA_END=828 /DNA_ORIENTATION=+